MEIRPELDLDHFAVDALVRTAMGEAEARLITQLRADGDVAFALVATEADEVVGHIMFSRMAAPFRALGLAPLCVAPAFRRQGIGTALIETGLRKASGEWDAVFVVGDPEYYRRFGFDAEAAGGFDCPHFGPYFMVHDFGTPLPAHTGTVGYASAFGSLQTP
jgi:putative acetyltransferase